MEINALGPSTAPTTPQVRSAEMSATRCLKSIHLKTHLISCVTATSFEPIGIVWWGCLSVLTRFLRTCIKLMNSNEKPLGIVMRGSLPLPRGLCNSSRQVWMVQGFHTFLILCVTGAIHLHSAWGLPSDGFYSWVQKV